MGIARKFGLMVPPIRDIWEQRLRAISDSERLSEISEKLRDELRDVLTENSRLREEVEELKAKKPYKLVEFMGRQLVIHGREGDSYYDSIAEAHTNEFLAFVSSNLSPSESVSLDIGANVGLIATALSSVSKSVHSFEPSPRTWEYLQKTLAANAAKNVIANQVALGSEQGELRFFEDFNSGSASHLITEDTLARSSEVIVPVSTIDDYVREKSLDRLDFIKIDIEGFEIDALRGGREAIRELKPSALIEFNAFTMIGFRNINPRGLLDEVRSLFPFVYRWNEGSPEQIKTDAHALSFIHDNLVSVGCVDDVYGSFHPL